MDRDSQKCKIVLLGDQSVGKTSVINRFIFDNFTGNEQPTVGVDFVSKNVNVQNKNLRMQLWDTAGQERFQSLIPSYIKDCGAAIIVFDITNITSFNNLGKWIDNVRETRGEEALIMIVGNKSDLEEERAVEHSVASEKIKELGFYYNEISAKSGANVRDFFKDLAITIVTGNKKAKEDGGKVEQNEAQTNTTQKQNISLTATKEKSSGKKKGCC